MAAAAGISRGRVDELLELVGIPAAARKRAGGYSMGMRQRLGLAAALLGDPRVIILDEPANGLDPDGIRWLRGFLRHLASEGRTLLISSHMLSEVEQTVDDVVIIANGKRIAQGTIEQLRGEPTAFVRTSDPDRLASTLAGRGLSVTRRDGGITVTTDDLAMVGDLAHAADIAIHELRAEKTHLEELYFNLTEADEYRNRNLGVRTGRPLDELPPPSGPPVEPNLIAVEPVGGQSGRAPTEAPQVPATPEERDEKEGGR